mgnify:FL=1
MPLPTAPLALAEPDALGTPDPVGPEAVTHPVPEPRALDEDEDEDALLPLLPDPEPLSCAEEPELEADAEADPEPDPERDPEPEVLPDEELLAVPAPPSWSDDPLLTNAMPASPWSTVDPGMRSGEQPTASTPSRAATAAMRRLEGWRDVTEEESE